MKSTIYILTIISTLALASCDTKSPKELDSTLIEEEVEQMLMAYNDSVRKNGITGEFFFLDKSDAFYWVPPGYKYALHYDSISNILRENASHFRYIDNSWDKLHIMGISDQYASFNGVINNYAITSDNDTIVTKLSETGIVVKRGNEWKLLSGQTVIIENE